MSKSRDEKWIEYCVNLACQKLGENHGGPFAAVVVKNDQLVAEGINQVTSLFDPTAHAEVQAIRKACEILKSFQLDDCDLYTSCEPCPMCLGAIYWARPSRVIYAADRKDAADAGFDDDFIYLEIQKSPQDRGIVFERLFKNDYLAPFKAWTKKIDRIAY